MDDILRRIEALENKIKEEGWVYDLNESKWITQKEMQSRIAMKTVNANAVIRVKSEDHHVVPNLVVIVDVIIVEN